MLRQQLLQAEQRLQSWWKVPASAALPAVRLPADPRHPWRGFFVSFYYWFGFYFGFRQPPPRAEALMMLT